jgi:hypothetical protein
MKPWSEKALARHKAEKIGVAVALLVASTRVVTAQEHERSQYGAYQNQPPCTSQDDCNRKAYDESGTPGRIGLGANPAHPEGPGNMLI